MGGDIWIRVAESISRYKSISKKESLDREKGYTYKYENKVGY